MRESDRAYIERRRRWWARHGSTYAGAVPKRHARVTPWEPPPCSRNDEGFRLWKRGRLVHWTAVQKGINLIDECDHHNFANLLRRRYPSWHVLW